MKVHLKVKTIGMMRITGIIGIFGIFKLSQKLCLHRPRGIMGISRILRMLGILRDDS